MPTQSQPERCQWNIHKIDRAVKNRYLAACKLDGDRCYIENMERILDAYSKIVISSMYDK